MALFHDNLDRIRSYSNYLVELSNRQETIYWEIQNLVAKLYDSQLLPPNMVIPFQDVFSTPDLFICRLLPAMEELSRELYLISDIYVPHWDAYRIAAFARKTDELLNQQETVFQEIQDLGEEICSSQLLLPERSMAVRKRISNQDLSVCELLEIMRTLANFLDRTREQMLELSSFILADIKEKSNQ